MDCSEDKCKNCKGRNECPLCEGPTKDLFEKVINTMADITNSKEYEDVPNISCLIKAFEKLGVTDTASIVSVSFHLGTHMGRRLQILDMEEAARSIIGIISDVSAPHNISDIPPTKIN